MARRLNARPSPAWVGDLPVFERMLTNGLKALVLPRKKSPIVVCDLFYPVGSADEPPGKSGLAHFLEHMLFKGTDRFPKGAIDHLAFVSGGQANAETSEDCTHFWFAFPADRWELALAIEADRMRQAYFDPREVEAERQVIGEERAREIESPLGKLDQTHLTVAYLRHPYRNPVLGWPEDVAQINESDLKAFYQAHYRPDGAVLVLAGDVNPAAAFDRIEAHFGAMTPGQSPRAASRWEEPPQTGRREFRLFEAEAMPRGLLGWHTVPRGHRDAPALDVLADLISAGRRSRLWQSLVEQDKQATWIEATHAPAHRAGQFFIQIEGVPEGDPAYLERRIAEVLAQLVKEGPTAEELARARHRLEAGWRWEQEDLAGLAAGVGHAAIWGDWRDWQAEHAAALTVDAAAVRRAAATYLTESGLTVGWSLPRHASRRVQPARMTLASREEPEVEVAPGPEPSPSRRGGRSTKARVGGGMAAAAVSVDDHRFPPLEPAASVARLADYRPHRVNLENGLRLIHERRPGTGVVALELYVDAGVLREARPGLACLTGRLLEEGTQHRSAGELAAAVEDVGGMLEVGATGASLRIRAEDLPLALELLSDVVRHPLFPDEALDWTRQRIAAEFQSDLEDPAFRADLIFRGMTYGDHPLGRDPRGGPRELACLTRDDVVAHHRSHFAPDRSFLVAVGDFDPRRLARLVQRHFGSWTPRHEAVPPLPPLVKPARTRTRRVRHDGEQVHLVLGHLGIPRNHPDHDALVVLDHIFGSGPGFADRLSRIVRDEMGLVYNVGGGMTDSADLLPGLFRVYAGTMPEEADRVIAAIVEQVRAMHAGAFSDDEVDRARRYLASAWVFDFQTVEQRAERLLELERWGMSLDEPRHWAERIAGISPRMVRAAAKAHLHPDALWKVEYGPILRRGHRPRAECA